MSDSRLDVETQKKILAEYDEIERYYRLYKYAKETSDMYLLKYIKRVQGLPHFCVPHMYEPSIVGGLTNEDK